MLYPGSPSGVNFDGSRKRNFFLAATLAHALCRSRSCRKPHDYDSGGIYLETYRQCLAHPGLEHGGVELEVVQDAASPLGEHDPIR